MKHQPTETSLREVFGDWTEALNTDRLDHFYDYFRVLDEDYPWRTTQAEFIDHIAGRTQSPNRRSTTFPTEE